MAVPRSRPAARRGRTQDSENPGQLHHRDRLIADNPQVDRRQYCDEHSDGNVRIHRACDTGKAEQQGASTAQMPSPRLAASSHGWRFRTASTAISAIVPPTIQAFIAAAVSPVKVSTHGAIRRPIPSTELAKSIACDLRVHFVEHFDLLSILRLMIMDGSRLREALVTASAAAPMRSQSHWRKATTDRIRRWAGSIRCWPIRLLHRLLDQAGDWHNGWQSHVVHRDRQIAVGETHGAAPRCKLRARAAAIRIMHSCSERCVRNRLS